MSVWQLTDGTSVFSFYPQHGAKDGGMRTIDTNKARNGQLSRYVRNTYNKFTLPVANVNSSGVNLVNGWFENNTILSLTSSYTSVNTVIIVGQNQPLTSFHLYDSDFRRGVIELEGM